MSVRILLVDPSEKWIKEAKKYFTDQMYDVVTACDGKNAQLALYSEKEKFFAIVLNLDITNHPGPQVLKYIKTYHPSMKVILTVEKETTLEEVGLNKKNLEKQGIVDVFFQPVDFKNLKGAIEGIQEMSSLLGRGPDRKGQSGEEEVALDDQRFTSINIDEFVSSRAVQFDVYIRLDSGKYIKILHSGDSFSKERIDKYKNEKNLKKLYFLTEDRKKYIRMQNFIADKAIKSESIDGTTKMQLTKNAGEMLVEEIYTDGIKPQSLDQGKTLCQSVYNLAHSNKNLWSLLKQYRDFDPSAYAHGYLVTLFSCVLVKQFEWDSKIVNETVGMAGILHDIGKLKLNPNLLNLRPAHMTAEELAEYKKHPELGSELLASNNMVSSVVRQIVLQHHECNDGSGFPFGLKRQNILTFSKIIFLVDDFVHIMLDEKLGPPEALKAMLKTPDCINRYNGQLLEHFLKVFINPEKLEELEKK